MRKKRKIYRYVHLPQFELWPEKQQLLKKCSQISFSPPPIFSSLTARPWLSEIARKKERKENVIFNTFYFYYLVIYYLSSSEQQLRHLKAKKNPVSFSLSRCSLKQQQPTLIQSSRPNKKKIVSETYPTRTPRAIRKQKIQPLKIYSSPNDVSNLFSFKLNNATKILITL